jgi:hypothetical protein
MESRRPYDGAEEPGEQEGQDDDGQHRAEILASRGCTRKKRSKKQNGRLDLRRATRFVFL